MNAVFDVARGYLITLHGFYYVGPVVPVAFLVATAVLFASAATRTVRSDFTLSSSMIRHTAVVTVIVWAAYTYLGNTHSASVAWVAAVLVSVGAVLVWAWRLGSCEGLFLCAGVAIAATSVNGVYLYEWWMVAVVVAGLLVGVVTAQMYPLPLFAIGGCALICAVGVLPDTMFSTVVYAFLLPVAGAHALAVTIPKNPAIRATGLLLPIMLCLFAYSAPLAGRFDFSWAPYDLDLPTGVLDRPQLLAADASGVWTAVGVAVATGVVALMLSRKDSARCRTAAR